MHIKVYYDVYVDGKQVIRRRLSRSWVQGFVRLLYAQMSQATVTTQPDTGNTNRSMTVASGNLGCTAAASVDTNGIVVGTGTTGIATSDYHLATQILTGNTSGKLAYQAQTFNGTFQSASLNYFSLIRTFVNNSGASITVNELGIYGTGGAGFQFCLLRDVLGTGVVVANNKTLTVTYLIEFAV